MGNEFIRKGAKSFRKSWDTGRVKITAAKLLSRIGEGASYSGLARLDAGRMASVGDKLTVQQVGPDVVALHGLSPVARFTSPTSDLQGALDIGSGVAFGTVTKVHALSGMVDITLCSPPTR